MKFADPRALNIKQKFKSCFFAWGIIHNYYSFYHQKQILDWY